MASDVVSTGRGGDASWVKSGIACGKSCAASGWADDDVGRAGEGWIGDAGVQAEADRTEAGVVVAKDLVEVTDA